MTQNDIQLNSTFLPDSEISNAVKFGFNDYSKTISLVISDVNLQTPFVIGIHGEWGSGKTSLMSTIESQLRALGNNRIKTIWFNAWEFEKLSVPLWAVFINRVLIELQEMASVKELKNKLRKIGRSILLVSSDILLRNIKFLDTNLKEVCEDIQNNVLSDIEKIDSLKDDLQKAIKEVITKDPEKRRRIAIFVDDVDRCLPEQTVQIFESIKLFLNCENCVFILGIDKEQIKKAFEHKFGPKGPSGLLYLEKFIQLQFDLPRKTPSEVADFLKGHISEQLRGNPRIIELISRFIEPNPRKIKRWINSVSFLETLFKVKQEKLISGPKDVDVSLVSIWMFLKAFFPDFASYVESDVTVLSASIRAANGKGSSLDYTKVADFAADKRLNEFLASLQFEYSDEQLKDVVYLSRLSPSQNVSVLPQDVIKRIASLNKDEITFQISILNNESLLSLAKRIIGELGNLESYQEYNENKDLFELLDYIYNVTKDELTKQDLFANILWFYTSSGYAQTYFQPKVKDYIKNLDMQNFLDKNSWILNVLVDRFAQSRSFAAAAQLAEVLSYFKNSLNVQQLNKIIKATVTNNQISDSYDSQNYLQEIFTFNQDKISRNQFLKLQRVLGIELWSQKKLPGK